MNPTNLLADFSALFYPRLCAVCGEPLVGTENALCLECLFCLPRTNYHRNGDNPAADRFAGKIQICRASSFLYYNKGGMAQKIIEDIKYHGNQHLGEWTGALMGTEMAQSAIIRETDIIAPVPLHRTKLRKRGYNQAESIARGLSAATGIAMLPDNIIRTRANPTQTKKGLFERWTNTQQLFETVNPSLFANKNILLIDDVLTSGSTLEAAARAVLVADNAKVSILTIAIA
jgi:ComF family protein